MTFFKPYSTLLVGVALGFLVAPKIIKMLPIPGR